jgi:hypothetical protein
MATTSSKLAELASIAGQPSPEGLAYVLVVARAALPRSSTHRPNRARFGHPRSWVLGSRMPIRLRPIAQAFRAAYEAGEV